jgi:hypothetical protein
MNLDQREIGDMYRKYSNMDRRPYLIMLLNDDRRNNGRGFINFAKEVLKIDDPPTAATLFNVSINKTMGENEFLRWFIDENITENPRTGVDFLSKRPIVMGRENEGPLNSHDIFSFLHRYFNNGHRPLRNFDEFLQMYNDIYKNTKHSAAAAFVTVDDGHRNVGHHIAKEINSFLPNYSSIRYDNMFVNDNAGIKYKKGRSTKGIKRRKIRRSKSTKKK